jgi:hypothetical protein
MSRIHSIQVTRCKKSETPNARINGIEAIYDSIEHLMQDFQPAPVTKYSAPQRIGSKFSSLQWEEVPKLQGLIWRGTTPVGRGKVIVHFETLLHCRLIEDDGYAQILSDCRRNAKRA